MSMPLVIIFLPFAGNGDVLSSPYNGIVEALENSGVKLKIVKANQIVGESLQKLSNAIDEDLIVKYLNDSSPDLVISINNHGITKKIRNSLHCPVVKWIFDDFPHNFIHESFLNLGDVFDPNDIIFAYSTRLLEKIRKCAPHLKKAPIFLPHATNTSIFKKGNKAGKGISFVGSYLDVGPALYFLQKYGTHNKTMAEKICASIDYFQRFPNCDPDYLIKEFGLEDILVGERISSNQLALAIANVVSTRERIDILSTLKSLDLKIYGRNDWLLPFIFDQKLLSKFQYENSLDGQSNLARAYQGSAITIDILNVQNDGSVGGRVIEAMAAGTLLITKYQENSDLNVLFGSDNPIPQYTSNENLYELCSYYLEHNEQRNELVDKCRKLVEFGFDYHDRIEQIFSEAGIHKGCFRYRSELVDVDKNFVKNKNSEAPRKNKSCYDLASLTTEIKEFVQEKEFDAALFSIIDFVQFLNKNPRSFANLYSSEHLDQLCLLVGSEIEAENNFKRPIGVDSDVSVYLASHLAEYGGHTHVLMDFINSDTSKKKVIILTDLFNHVDVASITKKFEGCSDSIEFAPYGSPLKKYEWLAEKLSLLRPKRIFLFNHHEDSVIVSSINSWIILSNVYFIHHADTNLTLGAKLKNVVHIDLHNIGFDICRNQLGVNDNVYLPLTVPDRGFLDCGTTTGDCWIKTCSSGTYNKFSSGDDFLYFDVIAERLSKLPGNHVHIGKIPEADFSKLRSMLQARKINADRFVNVAWVPSVWDYLKNESVDLYISSFPVSGGRATIEALGSGTPIIAYISDQSRFNGGVDLMYDEVLTWRTKNEFIDVLSNLNPSTLRHHRKLARNHYLRNYTTDVFVKQLHNIVDGRICDIAPPKLHQYSYDSLVRFLNGEKYNIEKSRFFQVELKQLEDQIVRRDAIIKDLMSSNSWRITSPLRWIFSLLKPVFSMSKID